MAENVISVDVELAIKQAQSDIDKLSKQFTVFGQNLSKQVGEADSAFKTFKGTLAALGLQQLFNSAMRAAKDFARMMIVEGVAAARDQQDAIQQLNFALASSGILLPGVSQRFQDLATQIQSTTKFSDDAVLGNIALMQSLGRMDEQGLRRATVAATNLSAALGMDLSSASRLVAKAAAGNTAALSRYGIVLEEGGTKAERFEKLMGLIENRFGGAAQAQVLTFSGSMARLSNLFNDLQEEIGFVIIQNPILIKGISMLADQFVTISSNINKNREAYSQLFSVGIIGLLKGLSILLQVGDGTIRFFTGLGQAISALGSVIVTAWLGTFATLTTALDSTFGTILEKLGVENPFKDIAEAARSTFGTALEDVKTKGEALGKTFSEEGALGDVAKFVDEATLKLEAFALTAKAVGDDVGTNNDKNKQKQITWEERLAKFGEFMNSKRVQDTKSSLATIATLQQSGNKELFFIGKAAAVGQATIDGIAAVQKALAALPPPFNFVLAGLVGVATAANVSKIASQQPGFAAGGIVGGNSLSGDNVNIRTNSREAVFTLEQQQNLFDKVNNNDLGGGGISVTVMGNIYADSDSQVETLIERISDAVLFRNVPLAASRLA